MQPTSSATVLQVADITIALTFYRDVLGFTEDFRYDNYVGVCLGAVQLHLCAHSIWKRPVGSGAVGIVGEEVDEYCATIKDRGGTILLEPTDEPYGLRDFVTRDPDGNILTFGAPIPTPASEPKNV